ncbi:MAG: tRNA (guanosine(37)-N1)-methyltransferase TrmD [Treponema sp.]|jgi:tRNA (guanine37-N1)-methyltransferase|nr:tRNA (guanosine(37)-N1)-methyltransferase TrmD [Treponema sp.]
MKYTVLSLFPEIVDAFVHSSIMAKAIERGIVEYQSVNIRDFAFDKHRTCDDAPYGGGAGMLMLVEPLSRAFESVGARNRFAESEQNESGQCTKTGEANNVLKKSKKIYLTPSGRLFNQSLAVELVQEDELVLLCGRYEGVDQRVVDAYIDEEISVGDYVLSSGEAAAITVIDATYRLVDRVISPESLVEESFTGGLLEYPQWTRPEIYGELTVPDVLLSGHHENIRHWHLQKRVEKTLMVRPDLIKAGLKQGLFDAETRKIIKDSLKSMESDKIGIYGEIWRIIG